MYGPIEIGNAVTPWWRYHCGRRQPMVPLRSGGIWCMVVGKWWEVNESVQHITVRLKRNAGGMI